MQGEDVEEETGKCSCHEWPLKRESHSMHQLKIILSGLLSFHLLAISKGIKSSYKIVVSSDVPFHSSLSLIFSLSTFM